MAIRLSALTRLFRLLLLLLAASIGVTSLAAPALHYGSSGSLAGNSESDLDPATGRRLLQTWDYISYGALHRDSTPCSLPGASYYNCRPGSQANPYNRGCSAITQCR